MLIYEGGFVELCSYHECLVMKYEIVFFTEHH